MRTIYKIKSTQEELEAVIKLFKQGLSLRQIKKRTGLHLGFLSKYLKTQGFTINSNGRKLNLSDIESKIGTPEFDYILGILASDGSVSRDVIYLCFSNDNKEILNHWTDFLLNKYEVKTRLKNGVEYYYTSFANKEFAKLLYSYGITPRKSYTLNLKYINWNVLRGVFDGDGSLVVDKRKNLSWKFSIVSASSVFIDQVKLFLNENDIHCNIYYTEKDHCYKLIVGRLPEIMKVYNNMYKNATYFLNRKYVKFGPLVEKFISKHSVNSGKEESNLQS